MSELGYITDAVVNAANLSLAGMTFYMSYEMGRKLTGGEVTILETIFGKKKMTMKDFMKSVSVIGQTGTGKSTFLINLVHILNKLGCAIFFINFKDNKTAIDLLDTITDEQRDQVNYISPLEGNLKIGMSPFGDKRDRASNDRYVDNIVSIFKAIFPKGVFANTEDILNGVYAGVAEMEIRTPLEAYMCINTTDKRNPRNCKYGDYRLEVQRTITNPFAKSFFEHQLPQRLVDDNRIGSPQNKMNRITDKIAIQYTLCQEKPKFKMEDHFNKGDITIFNFSQQNLGVNQAKYLCSFTLGMLKQAAFQREDISTPILVFTDEFPQYTTSDFPDIIDMGRAMKTAFVLACQYMGKLDEPIRKSIDGSVGTKFYFRTGKDDAETYHKHLGVTLETLTELEDYYFIKDELIHGKKGEIKKAHAPFPRPKFDNREYIVNRTMKRYGVPAKQIEDSIERRLNYKEHKKAEKVKKSYKTQVSVSVAEAKKKIDEILYDPTLKGKGKVKHYMLKEYFKIINDNLPKNKIKSIGEI